MLVTSALAVFSCGAGFTWTDLMFTTRLSTSASWRLIASTQPPLTLLSCLTRVPARTFVQIFFCSPAVASLWRFEITCAISCSSPLNAAETELPQAARPTASRQAHSSAAVRLRRTGMAAQRVRDPQREGAVDGPLGAERSRDR